MNSIDQQVINDLYDGRVQVFIIKNAVKEDVQKFGELEIQDLYLKKEVPIGQDESDHVLQEYDMMWHSDRAYNAVPHTFGGLYCVDYEEGASPTYFHDNIKGWQELPKDLQEKVKSEGPVFHSIRTYFDRADYPHNFRSKAYERHFKMNAKGNHSLYYNDKFGEYIFFSEGYANTKYLDELKEHMFKSHNCYTHNWEVGDLVVWNNYTTAHRRDHTEPHVKRKLIRYAFHAI